MVGLWGRWPYERVKPEVAPWLSTIGELRISSREGIGKLGSAEWLTVETHTDGKPKRSSPVLATDLAGSASMRPNLGPERVNLLNDQLLHAFDRVLVFETEIKLGGAYRFIRGVVPDL